MKEKVGRCYDCTAPQTEVNILSRHILELQADKGRLTDKVKELEAEVKEWKDKADLWCKTANLKDHNIMINKELEKENAELKAVERMALYSKMSDQLTKAKDLLKKVTDVCGYPNYDLPVELYADIEHFLSEVNND